MLKPAVGLLPAFVLACGCAPKSETTTERRPRPAVSFPAACQSVSPRQSINEAVANAAPGAAFCLGDGEWREQVVLPVGVGLWGSERSVVRSTGVGTTIFMNDRTSVHGVTVDGSGGRFDVLDAAVKVHGDDVVVEGVTVEHSAFGILVEKSKRATIRGNRVIGLGGPALGLRGDGIRLWETNDSLVEGNDVDGVRDCVVWYSSRNTLRDNTVRDSRYGIHFMYSHGNRVEHSRFLGNEVGLFAMYSRDLAITDNQILGSRGSAGIGIGVKESGNLTVRANVLAHNTQGFFLDNSPLNPGDKNLFVDNSVRLSEIGVGFLSSTHDNEFRGNTFRDNASQVRVDGGGDAMAVTWTGNEWSDYVGYDLDGDGFGDLPYELKDLSGALIAEHADLAFLRGTPALALLSVAGEVVPLLAPKPILRDLRPRFDSRGNRRAN